MSEAFVIAVMGAVFNAGILWGTLRVFMAQIEKRMERSEKSAERAHDRIDALTLRVGGTD